MASKYHRTLVRSNPATQRFVFATGIECSYPTVATPAGEKRRDQLEECGHYDRWREDLQLTRDLGIRMLRYGPPWYRMHLAPGRYDWEWTDEVFAEMRRLEIVPVVDLCHFGVPDWLGSFQNPEFPRHFADYARAFAERYQWVRFYTPVNEMYVAAQFSAYYGWWNERLTTHEAFVTALKHLVRANVDGMLAIIPLRPDAIFIQSESSEYFHTARPELQPAAAFFNERRFLTLDLNYGHPVSADMLEYLQDNGMTREEYGAFMSVDLREHCIMGNDYYASNEHVMVAEERNEFAGDIFGYYVVTRDYYSRYNLPVMHTETNMAEPDAVRWLWKTWANVQRLRQDGVPLVGMTWFSLIDQVDWDTALQEVNGRANPLGLYDLDRKLRPVGATYRDLAAAWSETPLRPNGPLTVLTQWYAAPEGAARPAPAPPRPIGASA